MNGASATTPREPRVERRDGFPPPVLFKYPDANGADKVFARDGSISLKFTPPDQFNDPFDCSPGGFKPESEAVLRGRIVESIYWHEPEFREKYRREGHDFNAIIDGYRSGRIPIDGVQESLDNFNGNVFQSEFSKGVAILSLSENDRDLLMWSHYADHHRGIVLGIKSSAFSRFLPLYVRYSEPFASCHPISGNRTR